MQDLFSYRYPIAPGFKDRTTSQDAAIKILQTGAASRHAQRCLDGLQAGPATAKELAARIGLSWDCTRPRLTQLRMQGKIERTGERRDGQHVVRLVIPRS